MVKSTACRACGAHFEYESKGGRARHFCSVECGRAKRGRIYQKDCAHCGQSFSYYRRGSRQISFCSRSCANKAKVRPKKIEVPSGRNPQIERPCEMCAAPMVVWPSEATRFCSRRCQADYAMSGARCVPCKACGKNFSTRSSRHTWCTTCRASEQNRDARIIVARRGMTPSDFRDAADYRSLIANDPCVWCGSPAEHVDHIHPIARAGTDRWDNYAPACRSCNLSKHAKTVLIFLARGGLTISGQAGTEVSS